MFESLAFWLVFALSFAVAHLLPQSAARGRATLLTGTSLFALFYVLELSPTILLILLGAIAWILA